MNEQNKSEGLLAAVEDNAAYIVVRDRATYRMSAEFKRLCLRLIGGGVTQLILDMDQCTGMDSTFMGVVGGLALNLRKKEGCVLMVNLSAHLRGLLGTLGLDTLVKARTSGTEGDERLADMLACCRPVPIQPGRLGRTAQAETMLDAHQTLADLHPENEVKFRDVLAYLREDLARNRQTGKDEDA